MSKTIATAKMELISQNAANFKKNLDIVAIGVLNALLEYYTYSQMCAGDQIKYCRNVGCNFSKDNLFYRLMNYLNCSSDYICISYPIR